MSNSIAAKREQLLRAVQTQTIAVIAAIAAAVVFPQIFHVLGAVSGMTTALGETFLPMHLPILLTGLLAGPYAGGIAGLLAPAVSFALSGMPSAMMMPFMMLELCIYGLSAGILKRVQMPVIGKVVISQIAGRVVRTAAILLAVYVLGNDSIRVSAIWMSVATGAFGIVLQWTFLPLIVYRIENRVKHEGRK